MMKSLQKVMNVVGLTLLLVSTFLTPIGVVAQTISNSDNPALNQTVTENQENLVAETNIQEEQATMNTDSIKADDESNQISEATSSEKGESIEETNETEPNAPPQFREAQVVAQELQNVITDAKLYDVSNGRYLNPDASGTYQLTQNVDYKYETKFDLSAYDGQLADGSHFTFTLPASLTVTQETFDLIDKETGIAVGEVVVTSNGENKGGVATIILKNLNDYLAKKGGSQIQGLKGIFYTTFKVTEVTEEKEVPLKEIETTKQITHRIKVTEKKSSDYSETIGKENFSKNDGLLRVWNWNSPLLGKSGKYHHPFVLRINTRQAAYNTIRIHDYIADDNAPAQFIPETFKVQWGHYTNSLDFVSEGELVEGVDYTVTWNSAYTDFVAHIQNAATRISKNGKPATYRVLYSTTAPADGSKIANTVEVSADSQELTNTTNSTTKKITSIRDSKITSGGTIQLETGYRLTLYKVDKDTNNRLAGAQFKITPPAGADAQEEIITTNQDGIAQSSVYSASDIAKGQFTATEVKAPDGYELDPTPIKLTIGANGIIRTIPNKKLEVKISLEVTKKLVGRNLQDDEFEFSLVDDTTGEELETAKNKADGRVHFKELTFDKVGVYTYTITEKVGNLGGVTYDTSKVKAIITVTDDGAGQLQVSVTYENNDQTFENTYSANKATATLMAKKLLEGRNLKADEFEFELKDAQNQVLQTKTNDDKGIIKFDAIEYSEAGVHTYTITEKAGSLGGVTYDTKVIKATVTVTDDGKGKLVTSVTYDQKDVTFKNTYTPADTSAQFEVKKELTGRSLQDDEFEFSLIDDATGKELETAQNKADGNVSFTALSYKQVGTYHYTIKEKNTQLAGITYDSKEIKVTVTVTDDGAGKLLAQVAYDKDDQTFTNRYEAKETSAQLSVTKVLTGRNLKADEFSFDLIDDKGAVLQTKKNAQDGTVTFDALSYDKVGQYSYTIKEIAGSLGGVAYDTKELKATVTVTDDGAGKLLAQVAYDKDDQTFTNRYEAKETSAQLSVTKVLTGRDLKADEFSFDLIDDKGVVLQTKKNSQDGKVAFDAITYQAAGTYTYTIKEKVESLGGITYDTKELKATVTVTDDGAGQLHAKVAYEGEIHQFENLYQAKATAASITLSKQLIGRDLKENEFTFDMTDASGKLVQSKKNDASGLIAFDSISYEKAGVYRYDIKERNEQQEGITYDAKVIQVVVTVTDDGAGQLHAQVSYEKDIKSFENSYRPPEKPTTPKENPALPKTHSVEAVLLWLSGLLLLIGTLVYRFRKGD